MQNLQRQAGLHTECIKCRLRVLNDLFMQLFFLFFWHRQNYSIWDNVSAEPYQNKGEQAWPNLFIFFQTKCPLEGSGNVVASSQRRAWCWDEPKVNQKDTLQEYTAMAVSMVLL